MKKMLLAGAVLLAFASGPVTAADMGQPAAPAPVYTKAPMMPVYSWTGGYIGINGGYSWGDSEAATTTINPPLAYFALTSPPALATAGAQSIKPNGFTGGGQIGYNWQASSSIVLGLEADIEYYGLKGSSSATAVYPCCAPSTFTIAENVKTDWLATFRARLGYLVTPSTLLYVTGGGAVTNLQANFAFTDTFGATESGAFTTTKLGWTAGGGVEWAMSGGWSAKAEYLFVSFPSVSVTSTNLALAGPILFPNQTFTHSADLDAHIVRLGLNYKFGGPVVAKY
jgi:outer membrane immunogenic protein